MFKFARGTLYGGPFWKFTTPMIHIIIAPHLIYRHVSKGGMFKHPPRAY
jgi:hypothetical protein